MSHILNITVPDTVYETLTRTAHQTGQSLEVVASKWLAVAAKQFADDPLDPFIGAFDSRGIDWADSHDHYLGRMPLEDLTGEEQ